MPREKNPNAKPADPARRRLLSATPLVGAAALVGTGREAEAGVEGDPADPRDTVYRMTEHVRAYYARARG